MSASTTGRGLSCTRSPAPACSSRAGLCCCCVGVWLCVRGTSGETGRLLAGGCLVLLSGVAGLSCFACAEEEAEENSGGGLAGAACFCAGGGGVSATGLPSFTVGAAACGFSSSGDMEVMERVREREKEGEVEILMGSRKVEDRRGARGERSGECWGEKTPETRLRAVGGVWGAVVASSGWLRFACEDGGLSGERGTMEGLYAFSSDFGRCCSERIWVA